MLHELAWFLPWCWFANVCLNGLGYATRAYPRLGRRDWPLDGGKLLCDGHRILGDSTTWGGLLLVMALGMLGAVLWPGQHLFMLALLVFSGHAAGSFLKRRLGIRQGGFAPLLDHGDYVLVAGSTFFALGLFSLPALAVSWLLTLVLTPAITLVAFRFRVRAEPL